MTRPSSSASSASSVVALSPAQLRLLQAARRQVERLAGGAYDEPQWRLTLRNVGAVAPDARGHVSARGLTQAGFERVMAFLESKGGAAGSDPEHWQRRAARRGGYATTRQVWAIRRLAPQSPYPLEAICRRATSGYHERPEDLTIDQARRVIEALKAIEQRTQPQIPQIPQMENREGA